MTSRKPKVLTICREDFLPFYQPTLNQQDWKVDYLTTEEQLINYFSTGNLQQISFVVLQIRLRWNEDASYGLRIAARLRVIGMRCPIYLFSFLPKAYFDLRLPQHALLRASSHHHLVTLPLATDFWEKLEIQPMLEYKRLDIVRNLLDPRSLVSEVIHELKNKVFIATQSNQWMQINSLIHQKFAELRVMFPQHLEGIKATENKLLQQVELCLTPQHIGQVSGFIDGTSPILQSLFPNEEAESPKPSKQNEKTPWKVLFFDDEKGMHSVFRMLFAEFGIECITCEKGELALDLLQQDQYSNRFAVVICDIRILQSDSLEWKKYQGYDVMWAVRQQLTNLVELVALTSGRSHLLKLLEDDQIKFHRALKQDVLSSEGSKRMFVNRIRDLGDTMFFKSRSRPKQSSWVKRNEHRFSRPLSHYYREHLLSLDYEAAEERINERALEFLDNVAQGYPNPSVEFTGTMNRDLPTSEEGLRKFRDRILLGRRIALALHLEEQKSEEEIYRIMMQKTNGKADQSTINQLLTTGFALSLKKDLPSPKHIEKGQYLGSGLLEEEILWLLQHFNVDFELRGLRSSEKDKAIITLLLDDFRDRLQRVLLQVDPEDKKLNKFLKAKFENIRDLPTAQSWLREAARLAGAHRLLPQLRQEIQEELEENTIQSSELRFFLEKQFMTIN